MLDELGVFTEVSGRVVAITATPQVVRVRGRAVAAGCHWLGEHVLCGGNECLACDRGHPKRPFFFLAVDSPSREVRILRVTPKDMQEIGVRAFDSCGKNEVDCGLQMRVWRPGPRRPLAVEYLGHTRGLIELSQEMVWLDVLRVHRICAVAADVRTGEALRLIRIRVGEAVSSGTGARS